MQQPEPSSGTFVFQSDNWVWQILASRENCKQGKLTATLRDADSSLLLPGERRIEREPLLQHKYFSFESIPAIKF